MLHSRPREAASAASRPADRRGSAIANTVKQKADFQSRCIATEKIALDRRWITWRSATLLELIETNRIIS
jgi:hypothetical protein